jgi:hypothetical protein
MRSKRLILFVACCSALVLVLAVGAGCGRNTTGTKSTITSITPGSGPTGTAVKITGKNFGATEGNGVVHIGSVLANVVAWSDTTITVKVPSGLKVVAQGVSVLTDAGESNQVDFTVRGGKTAPSQRTEGQVKHITAVQATIAFEQNKGVSMEDYTFSVVQISDEDPNWKIDQATKPGAPPIYFLLHFENASWVVKDDGNAINRTGLEAAGAPDDLFATPSPTTQAEAFFNYLSQRGIDPTGWSLTITRVSTMDSNWEEGLAHKVGQQDSTPRPRPRPSPVSFNRGRSRLRRIRSPQS